MRSDEAPQGGKRFLLDAADLHLRDADHPCHALLRQAVEIAKVDDRPLARRQPRDGVAQRNALDDTVLNAGGTQNILQREALLAALPLDGFGARRRRLRAGDLLGGQGKRLRKLRERRLPPTLTEPSSRRKRRISPAIFGTA